jgi:hypothetical protein
MERMWCEGLRFNEVAILDFGWSFGLLGSSDFGVGKTFLSCPFLG